QSVLIRSIERGVCGRGAGAGGRKDVCDNCIMFATGVPNSKSSIEQKQWKRFKFPSAFRLCFAQRSRCHQAAVFEWNLEWHSLVVIARLLHESKIWLC